MAIDSRALPFTPSERGKDNGKCEIYYHVTGGSFSLIMSTFFFLCELLFGLLGSQLEGLRLFISWT